MIKTKQVALIIFFFLNALKLDAQNPEIDSIKLAGLCKVWGLAKNYHISVISKKVDWDKIFIDRYPEIVKSNNPDYFNKQIIKLLDTLPKKRYKQNITEREYNFIINNQIQELNNFSFLTDTSKYKNRISFSWINDGIFTDEVKKELCNIIINYKPKRNKYLKGDIVLKHEENKYLELDSITEPYRVLALFRFWNTINYYFPYKYLMDEDWDTVLNKHINKIKNAPTYEKFMHEFISLEANLDDSHGFYKYSTDKYFKSDLKKTNDVKRGFIPYNFEILNNHVVVCKILTDSTSIETGDTILAINNIDLGNYIKNFSKHKSTSSKQSQKSIIEIWLSRIYNTDFNLLVKKNNDTIHYLEKRTVDFNTKTESFYRKPPFHYSINDSIGYIDITQIKLKEFNKAWKEFKNYENIIFDLRGYPETPAWLLLPHLLNKDKKDVAEFYYPSKKFPGIFIKLDKNLTYKFWYIKILAGFKKRYDKNIIVLINADAISQSETMAMMFKAYSEQVTFIGEPSSGANGNIVRIDIPGGIYFYFSSLDFHFPNGAQLQRIGIVPDIMVKRDIESIINNEDKILLKAVDYIKKQK